MAQSKNPFMGAIEEICDEKGLDKEIVIETVEAALAAAYRKDYGKPKQLIRAKMDPVTGVADMFRVYEVVETEEDVKEKEQDLTIDQAQKFNKKVKVGEEIVLPLEHHEEFGRIAAQTAKQVIIQRIREAERDMLFKEFKDKEGEIVNVTVQQLEGRNVVVTLGKTNAILYPADQIREERYYVGQRLRVYLKEVAETARGPQIIVSRSDKELITGLFKQEVPEINAGTVEIKSIAREAGSRTKMAVIANEDKIDPVGSCVGQRGTRVQAVLAEIGEEKIDIVLWDEDVEQFIMNALSPAKTKKININSKENKATVYVARDSLSLAIGKGGQNVRLASKLTGWRIDVVLDEEDDFVAEDETLDSAEKESSPVSEETEKKKPAKKTKSSKSKTTN